MDADSPYNNCNILLLSFKKLKTHYLLWGFGTLETMGITNCPKKEKPQPDRTIIKNIYRPADCKTIENYAPKNKLKV